ncbi:PREDICTED: uncharacterized protein LOC108746198 [Trachymyrmex septentrionalis]|uniref:uncharacterized protein LOC108746198 n=1 Tax=Trachymyrmex septentrionalis TaxID=34720 RepID=UPI00084F7838|nr:PREDICTED: uncharacterized protein LOC108746198 [Trachymyrmex septentrionalis]
MSGEYSGLGKTSQLSVSKVNYKDHFVQGGPFGSEGDDANPVCDNWLASNPGKTVFIYHIPAIVKTALPLATTSTNIQTGFRVSGISPLNENIFPESEFLGSYLTDRENISSIIKAENDELSVQENIDLLDNEKNMDFSVIKENIDFSAAQKNIDLSSIKENVNLSSIL